MRFQSQLDQTRFISSNQGKNAMQSDELRNIFLLKLKTHVSKKVETACVNVPLEMIQKIIDLCDEGRT